MDLPICRSCPSGFHAPDLQPFVQCIGCLRGKYGDYVAAANATVGCKSCVPGRYSAAESLTDTVGKIPCIGCPKGRYSSDFNVIKESACFYCSPGRYNSEQASSNGLACVPCVVGKYAVDVGAITPEACKSCPAGFSMSIVASAYCISCRAGKFSIDLGKETCEECRRGRYKNALANPSEECALCPEGYAQNTTAQAQCLPCLPGRTIGSKGNSVCINCKIGRYVGTEASATINCDVAPVGRYVADGSTATIEVPDGFQATACVEESGQGCQSNQVCLAGTFGALPPTETCLECEKGYYSR